MHGYLRTELLAQKSAIAGMIKIPMGENDELEIAGLAARAFEFFLEAGALIRTPRVDQDKAGIGLDEVAVYAT